MGNANIKPGLYKVKTKNRDRSVIVLPTPERAWSTFDDVYCYDCDYSSLMILKDAIACAIKYPDSIIYIPFIKDFPISWNAKTTNDALRVSGLVLTNTKCQFKRSSWIQIRRSLSKIKQLKIQYKTTPDIEKELIHKSLELERNNNYGSQSYFISWRYILQL